MTVGTGVLAAAGLGITTLICFPEVLSGLPNGDSTTSNPTSISAAYDGSVSKFVEAVDAKYPGQVAPNDAAIIGYSVCQAFDADPATAYQTFMAKEAAAGAGREQAAFMTRTAVATICPRHKSHLP